MKCQKCGMDAYMGFTCSQCGKYYCAKDRLPERHECTNIGAARDERQFRAQLENAAVQRSDRSASQSTRGLYVNRATPEEFKVPEEDRDSPLDEDLDDGEGNDNRYVVTGSASGMPLYLLIFGLFAVFDVINLIVIPSIWTMLPVLVHSTFLPMIAYHAYKQQTGVFSPRAMVTFIKLLIAYMLIYLATGITMGLVFGNFVGVAINIFIGICMVMMWSRVLQQMRFMSGGR